MDIKDREVLDTVIRLIDRETKRVNAVLSELLQIQDNLDRDIVYDGYYSHGLKVKNSKDHIIDIFKNRLKDTKEE